MASSTRLFRAYDKTSGKEVSVGPCALSWAGVCWLGGGFSARSASPDEAEEVRRMAEWGAGEGVESVETEGLVVVFA